MNNALTSLCFIVDERVFNIKDYPDFIDFVKVKTNSTDNENALNNSTDKFMKFMFDVEYKEWIRLIGGIKNEFLRNLIKDKRLS